MCIRDSSKAVLQVFKKLYDEDLIYRGERIINWCPHCKTSISDAEVEYEEQNGFFWHLKYPIVGTDEYLELATTRPETMLGDTAVAVHPDDERYTCLLYTSGRGAGGPFGRQAAAAGRDRAADAGGLYSWPRHGAGGRFIGTRLRGD